MTAAEDLAVALRQHLALCQEALELIEREARALCEADPAPQFTLQQGRKSLLARLDESLPRLRQQRAAWLKLPAADRARQPEVAALLRQNQDLIMKALVLDRENEQTLLRRGLVPPRHLPPANRQRPHFVAELYRRSAVS